MVLLCIFCTKMIRYNYKDYDLSNFMQTDDNNFLKRFSNCKYRGKYSLILGLKLNYAVNIPLRVSPRYIISVKTMPLKFILWMRISNLLAYYVNIKMLLLNKLQLDMCCFQALLATAAVIRALTSLFQFIIHFQFESFSAVSHVCS